MINDQPVENVETGEAPRAGSIRRVSGVQRWTGTNSMPADDLLAVEEPLQIRLAGEDVAVTMRTPGNDEELAIGFLFSEGIIAGKHHIDGIHRCLSEDGDQLDHAINVLPTDRGLVEPGKWRRDFFSASSCGICGKRTIEQIRPRAGLAASDAGGPISRQTLYSLPHRMRLNQAAFGATGGIHAAGLFDLDGRLVAVREDVGRHNAVDKIVGHAVLEDILPLDRHVLLVSSRASFEIVQKAIAAGICILAALSAPSTLAVEVARAYGLTLVAFLRESRLNVYSGAQRIIN